MAEEKREQEKETMDKTTSALPISPNLHKLVHQTPLCGGVLASLHIYNIYTVYIANVTTNHLLPETIHR